MVEELTAGFRVPREVIAYASRLLPHDRAGPGAGDVGPRDARAFFGVRAVPRTELDARGGRRLPRSRCGHEGSTA